MVSGSAVSHGWRRAGLCLGLALAFGQPSSAAQTDIVGPAGSGKFGTSVTVLPNGNIIVTDPYFGATDVGAVYLYTPAGALISTLTGSSADDRIGDGGVTVLGSGNYVVRSLSWDNAGAADAGAVTWGNAASGISGVVSAANSLVGMAGGDHVGSGGITRLSNGHYVVNSPDWDKDAWQDAGAVTWGSGTAGISGTVSATNSLIGPGFGVFGRVGSGGVTALTNGNYVVSSPEAYARGAVTWRSGAGGAGATVGESNSLMGIGGDAVGSSGVVALTNGNYVVLSPRWDNFGADEAGAVTWGDGSVGTVGVVSAANSLVGTTAADHVGKHGVTVLVNGNYVVSSCEWDNGAAASAGAATWGDGSAGTSGAVSPSNSLVGSTSGDLVCVVTALTNGNYVVAGLGWDSDSVVNAGSATWRNGTMNGAGVVSPLNSLVGTATNDYVATGGIWALSNGNYVVCSIPWHAFTSAVTWSDGATGTIGSVTVNNSLVGDPAATYRLGYEGIAALTNGNYVINTAEWDNGGATDAGAITWANGTAAIVGQVSSQNSFVGGLANDFLGFDGAYSGATVLSNGNYVFRSLLWDNGGAGQAGAVTWGNGFSGSKGVVSPANSLVGGLELDEIGSGGIRAFSDGNYAFSSKDWSDAGFAKGGAVTLAWGGGPSSGALTPNNSVFGTVPGEGAGMVFDYDPARKQLAVGRPASNIVSLMRLDIVFWSGFEAT